MANDKTPQITKQQIIKKYNNNNNNKKSLSNNKTDYIMHRGFTNQNMGIM